jgi:hypothetical protein
LVGALKHELKITFCDIFLSVGNVIIITDVHSIIFAEGLAQPPTSIHVR